MHKDNIEAKGKLYSQYVNYRTELTKLGIVERKWKKTKKSVTVLEQIKPKIEPGDDEATVEGYVEYIKHEIKD